MDSFERQRVLDEEHLRLLRIGSDDLEAKTGATRPAGTDGPS